MAKTILNADICIIGAGAAGLSIAAGAARLGRKTVLYESGKMGGDCLNYGCVPSKALITTAKHAKLFSDSEKFGLKPQKPEIDFTKIKAHIKQVIKTIAPNDSQARFEELGCTVIRERAVFKDKNTIISDTTITNAKRIIIATGSKANIPPIKGLENIDYHTNETIFDLDKLPRNLLIIGSGAIGLELAQAFVRLGSAVDIIDIARPLEQNDARHAQILIKTLQNEGVRFHAPVNIKQIKKHKNSIIIELENGELLKGSHLLLATGRKPVIENMGLDMAGINVNKRGITTNDFLQTSNKKVYAIGDVSGKGGLTHLAGFHASIIIKNFYFTPFFKTRAKRDFIPNVIYTAPELAQIGISEDKARQKYSDARIISSRFDENDRAIAERDTVGEVKIICRKNGQIIGASIIGADAGNLIQIIALAMANKQKIISLNKYIAPYPSRGEAVKRTASNFYSDMVFGEKAQKLASFWTMFH